MKNGEIYKVNNYLIILDDSIIFYDIKNNFEEIGKNEIKLSNLAILTEKYLVGEDNNSWEYHLISIEEKKEIKKKKYKPEKSFILKKVCDKWAFGLEINNKKKLIKIELTNNNNDIDLIPYNKESIIIESDSYLTNIFDEFFIVSKNGNISCYGCF